LLTNITLVLSSVCAGLITTSVITLTWPWHCPYRNPCSMLFSIWGWTNIHHMHYVLSVS